MINKVWAYSISKISNELNSKTYRFAIHNHDPRIAGMKPDEVVKVFPHIDKPGNYILCNSEDRRQELLQFMSSYKELEHYKNYTKTIKVIPSGISPKNYVDPKPLPDHIKDLVVSFSNMRSSRKKTTEIIGFGDADEIRVLISCAIDEHKNPYHAIEFVSAFAKHSQMPVRLIITGMQDIPGKIWKAKQQKYAQKIEQQIKRFQDKNKNFSAVVLGGVRQEYLASLFRHCDILLYPSTPSKICVGGKTSASEGFGMPPAEAAMCKRLCVVSRGLPYPSQVGSFLIDVNNIDGNFINLEKQAKSLWELWEDKAKLNELILKRYEFITENHLIDDEYFKRHLEPLGV